MAECSVSKKDIKFKWVAFKTTQKIGVGGTFNNYTILKNNTGKNIKQVLTGASIEIDTNSVNTKNKARDVKIAKFFFSSMTGGAKITATITSINSKKIDLKVAMNGKSVIVPMTYIKKNSRFIFKGHLDVLDLTLGTQIAAINKACSAKHKKTWNDVELSLMIKSDCKS